MVSPSSSKQMQTDVCGGRAGAGHQSKKAPARLWLGSLEPGRGLSDDLANPVSILPASHPSSATDQSEETPQPFILPLKLAEPNQQPEDKGIWVARPWLGGGGQPPERREGWKIDGSREQANG